MSFKRVDEALARRVLQAVLGVRVETWDQVRTREGNQPDLKLHLAGGPGFAEVVSTRDPRETALSVAMNERPYTPVETLTKLWFVYPAPGTRVNKLGEWLPAYLKDLEVAGVHQGPIWSDLRVLRQGLECFAVEESEHPPGYFLLGSPVGGFGGDGERALSQCEEFLASPLGMGKIAKLRKMEAAQERHLVVVLEIQAEPCGATFFFVQDGERVPPRAPNLPKGLEGLWLIPAMNFRPLPVLRWSARESRWDRVRLDLPAPVLGSQK